MEEARADYINLTTYEAVSRFRSIRRAIRRGHVSHYGIIYPNRPFNNRNRSNGTRPLEIEKERIYGQLKQRQAS